MFYPVESLKRGGRFYLCWVADSWPLRFGTITHRQLWSHDVRKICDDLMEVVRNESGRPVNRFSLRLSSQLMRGLARLYQKKVNVFLSDLCMINVTSTHAKHPNKKHNIPEVDEGHRASRPRVQVVTEEVPQIILLQEPENQQPVEEMLQNSSNVVSNIEDITLREATIPDFQLPPNDGFGEENPLQALQLAAGDRTVELMLAVGEPSGQHSGVELALDLTDLSTSRDARPGPRTRQMERLSEHDATIFRKSNGELVSGGDFEKDIQIPEIPDIVIPEIPIPPQEQLLSESEIIETREKPGRLSKKTTTAELEEIELEELEDSEPQEKRRRFRKIIIDKKTKLSANFLRARINNAKVDLRSEDSLDDVIDLRPPCEVYMHRPSHAGSALRSNLSLEITRLFMRNLGLVHRSPTAEREFQEEIMDRPQRATTRSMLERIEEVEEPLVPERPQPQQHSIEDGTRPENVTYPEISLVQDVNISKDILPEMEREVNISDMLTQKIDTVSQPARKRKSTPECILTPKKHRSVGYVSFRESQKNKQMDIETAPLVEPESEQMDKHTDKENVPANKQVTLENVPTPHPSKEAGKTVTAMLMEAGLADIQTDQAEVGPPVTSQQKSSKRQGSESSETPLGSLDRTKVSLGDSDQSTDSKRFIRDQWGTEGTMVKILKLIKDGSQPVTVWELVSKGPLISGYKAIIAARCFTSILKLKQHGFIVIKKNPETLEIEDIGLGPKFD